MKTILASRFIVPHFELNSKPQFEHYLLIADWRYYVKNETNIIEWADSCVPGWERRGMMLVFSNNYDITNFMLRWG